MSYEVQDFDRQVIERSRSVPVLVDFWAPWCGPCKTLGPVLESMAANAAGAWELIKVDVDAQTALAASHRVSSIPAVKLFRNGTVVDEFVGFRPEAGIRAWLEPHLGAVPPPPSTPATLDPLEQAAEFIDDGRLEEARTLLEQVLATDPARHAAKLLLAEILLTDAPSRARELLAGVPADATEHTHAQALGIIAAATERAPGDLVEDPVKPALLRGLSAARTRDWDAALEAFVEVAENRPSYAGGLAGITGKAIFRYLGIRHPIIEKHYRRFSSAVNS